MKSFCLIPLFLTIFSFVSYSQIYNRTDTLLIFHTQVVPAIDGVGDDESWTDTEWNFIDKIWMPYNNQSDNLNQENGLMLWGGAEDFSGKYKILWSSETNLLYFLAVITDDVFTDGYSYDENPNQGGNYPSYDILEIFIDENRSGGLHVFDATGSTGTSLGTNAENAFSYHLAANAPDDGIVQNLFHALDIVGTNWGYPSQKIADYANHFPEFALRKEGNLYIWEFSMEVHKENYNPLDQAASVLQLVDGHIMGISLAYCDNDNPFETPLRRDHFIGSVDVPLNAYNEHWKQADWFGVAKLVQDNTTYTDWYDIQKPDKLTLFHSSDKIHAAFSSFSKGRLQARILDLQGRVVFQSISQKTDPVWKGEFYTGHFLKGIYLMEITCNGIRQTAKFTIP